MKELKDIPELPYQSIFAEECIAYGIFEQGVIIHLMERDKCILVEWGDILTYGVSAIDQIGKVDIKEEEIPTATRRNLNW